MKNAKILLNLLLVFLLVLSICPIVKADTNNGEITVNEAVKGNTYKIYKVLNLVNYDENGNYLYQINEDFEEFFLTDNNLEDDLKEYVELFSSSEHTYITWKVDTENTSSKVAEFAQKLKNYINDVNSDANEDNNINASAEQTLADTAETNTVKFENLELGYYLVNTTTGSLVSLTTTDSNATINEKNTAPTVKKEISYENLYIGKDVDFTVTITVGKGAKNYLVEDKMTEGLDFDNTSLVVKQNNEVVSGANYTYTFGAAINDDCTFHVKFNDNYISSLNENDKIILTYSAKVNDSAKIIENIENKETEENVVKLKYGDNQLEVTDKEEVYLWEVNFFKYKKDSGEEKPLAGAKFTLNLKQDDAYSSIKLVSLGNNKYRIATQDEIDNDETITEITTNETGKFTIKGLGDKTTYYLIETEAPVGYNKLGQPIEFVITKTIHETSGEVVGRGVTSEVDGEVKILNEKGVIFPTTGGIGTTIFRTTGISIMLLFGIALIVKKIKKDNDVNNA